MPIQTINPTTNKVEQVFTEMTDEAVNKAIATSAATFETWKKTDYKLRAAMLHKVAGLLREKKKVLAQMITTEMGKLVAQAEGEIKLSAEIFDYYANHAESFLADKILNPIHGQALIRHSPIGVLLPVMVENYPNWVFMNL